MGFGQRFKQEDLDKLVEGKDNKKSVLEDEDGNLTEVGKLVLKELGCIAISNKALEEHMKKVMAVSSSNEIAVLIEEFCKEHDISEPQMIMFMMEWISNDIRKNMR